jgi:phage terminase small subunit
MHLNHPKHPDCFVEIRDTAMRQMMDLGERIGLTPAPSWDDFAPMAPEKQDDGQSSAGDAGDAKTT